MILIIVISACFVAGAHLLFQNLSLAWNKSQIENLVRQSLMRTEKSVDLAIASLTRLGQKGLNNCSTATRANLKSQVMTASSIRDIHLRSGNNSCAAFASPVLVTRFAAHGKWIKTKLATLRLADAGPDYGSALAVWKKAPQYDLVAIVATQGMFFDMVPAPFQSRIEIAINLDNGPEIAAYRPQGTPSQNTNTSTRKARQIDFVATSLVYPLTARATIDRQALLGHHRKNNIIVDLIAALVGILVGFLASRDLFPPPGPGEEMDKAIANGEFMPFFQPIIDLKSGRIAGFEMLARRLRPDGEMISPDQFIPLAENYGRIDALLFDLLKSAGAQLGEELRKHDELKLTFNITPSQFLDPAFLPALVEVVNAVGLPPGSLVAEITERQQLGDLSLASETVDLFKNQGIMIALDDTGTGHNGLSSIQKLDVSIMKLDKIFIDGIVDNERSRQIVEMLAGLARQYTMTVVAEGIENQEQADAALAMGIKEGQGFYFSRPVPANDLLVLLEQQKDCCTTNHPPLPHDRPASGNWRIAS